MDAGVENGISQESATVIDESYSTNSEISSCDHEIVHDQDDNSRHHSFSELTFRSEYRNSPIIHRRSRLDEILSIPDVAAALGDRDGHGDAEDDEKVALQWFQATDAKVHRRLQSPAYLKQNQTDSRDDGEDNTAFTFDEGQIQDLKAGDSKTDERGDDDQSPSSRSSSGSSSVMGFEDDNMFLPVIAEEVDDQEVTPSSLEVYSKISDSCGPLQSTQSGESRSEQIERLTKSFSGSDDSVKHDNNFDEPKEKSSEAKENFFDTYNRPTFLQRKNMRFSSKYGKSETVIASWRSLARAIARVRKNSLDDLHSENTRNHPITPIMKACI